MQNFLNATNVTLTIPLQDTDGNQLSPSAVEYRVTDHLGVEKVARAAVTSFTAGDLDVTITIDGTVNTVTDPRELRVVELFLTIGANSVLIQESYLVQMADPLVPGVNSYQTFNQAQLLATEIANMSGWSAASNADKITALIEARHHINQLSFSILGNSISQDNIDYAYDSATASVGDLRLITAAQFNAMDAKFKRALQLAQIAEADAILGGDSFADYRRSGVMAITVGESKQMFQSGKPLDLPVCKRAIGFLKSYVSYTLRAGR